MTTRVVVHNEGPHKDVVVDVMGKATVRPDEPHLVAASLVQSGEKAEFYVYDSQYLVVRERD